MKHIISEVLYGKIKFSIWSNEFWKTAILVQTAYNYEERNQKVIIVKPKIDTKGDEKIVSRVGISRKVDEIIDLSDSIIEKCSKYLSSINCIIVDEAQFLTEK